MNILSFTLIGLGLLVMIIGSYGVASLGDIYSRLQASSASDTGGFILVLLGFVVQGGLGRSDLLLGLLIVFVFITGPIITHTITKAAFLAKIPPAQKEEEDTST